MQASGSPRPSRSDPRQGPGPIEIAPGCFVTYDLEAVNILRALVQITANRLDALKRYYQEFVELHEVRPQAIEAFHDGYNPRAVRPHTGSWLGFVASAGGLDQPHTQAYERHRAFLEALETTPMTRSYKMLVLLAMLNEDRFPGEIPIDQLAEAVLTLASRNHRLRDDLGPSADTPEGLRRHLERNPIDAWTGGGGTGGVQHFEYVDGVFRTLLPRETDAERTALQDLVRELVDWRLAEYLQRPGQEAGGEPLHVCKVSHASGRPILFLPARDSHPELPSGPTPVTIDGATYEADFVKVALNVVRTPSDPRNRLPEILRGWFGPDAGAPGTRHEVALDRKEGTRLLRPLGRRGQVPNRV